VLKETAREARDSRKPGSLLSPYDTYVSGVSGRVQTIHLHDAEDAFLVDAKFLRDPPVSVCGMIMQGFFDTDFQ
jgi:hypothetical protein